MNRHRAFSRHFLLLLVLTSSMGLMDNPAGAQSSSPTTVQDYYLLMPQQYDRSTRAEREEILGYSEATTDIENGYIPETGATIQVTTAAGAKMYKLVWENGKFEKR